MEAGRVVRDREGSEDGADVRGGVEVEQAGEEVDELLEGVREGVVRLRQDRVVRRLVRSQAEMGQCGHKRDSFAVCLKHTGREGSPRSQQG